MKSKAVKRVLALIMTVVMMLTACPLSIIASALSEDTVGNPAIVYHDNLDRVIRRVPFTPGYTFQADYPAFEAGLQQKNEYWVTSDGDKYEDGDTLDNLREDLNVYPVLKDGCFVRFNSNGGSPVRYQFLASGGKATVPANPTKAGYTFGGWYTDDGTFAHAYDFNTAVTKETKLHAKWTEANTTYTVRVWLQQPDGTYRYNSSFTKTGITGGNVGFDPATESDIPAVKSGTSPISFPMYFCDNKHGEKALDKTNDSIDAVNSKGGIAGDGSTEINVYFRALVFDMTLDSGTYKYSGKTVSYNFPLRNNETIGAALERNDVKVDSAFYADLSNDFLGVNISWYYSCYNLQGDTGTAPIDRLANAIVVFDNYYKSTKRYPTDDTPMRATLVSDYDGENMFDRRGYSETIESAKEGREKDFTKANPENFVWNEQAWSSNAGTTNGYKHAPSAGFDYYFLRIVNDKGDVWTAPYKYEPGSVIMIPSQKNNAKGNIDVNDESTWWHTDFFQVRKHFNVYFDTPFYDNSTHDMVFEQPMSDLNGQITYTDSTGTHEFVADKTIYKDELLRTWVFKGWYDNDIFAGEPVDFAATTEIMPAEPITFYAKWEPVQITVTLDPTAGTLPGKEAGEKIVQTIDCGSIPQSYELTSPEGMDFVCWTLDGQYYDFSEPIREDATLVALFASNKAATVTYYVGSGHVGTAPVDSEKYAFNSTAKVLAATSSMDEMFICWEDENGNRYYPGDEMPMGQDDVRLTAVYDHTLIVNKVDADGNPVIGAAFALYVKSGDSYTLVEEIDGADKSSFNFGELEDGAYKLVETRAPQNYLGLTKAVYLTVIDSIITIVAPDEADAAASNEQPVLAAPRAAKLAAANAAGAGYCTINNGTTQYTLDAAVANAKSGDTIVVHGTVATANSNGTLNIGDKTLTIKGTGTPNHEDADSYESCINNTMLMLNGTTYTSFYTSDLKYTGQTGLFCTATTVVDAIEVDNCYADVAVKNSVYLNRAGSGTNTWGVGFIQAPQTDGSCHVNSIKATDSTLITFSSDVRRNPGDDVRLINGGFHLRDSLTVTGCTLGSAEMPGSWYPLNIERFDTTNGNEVTILVANNKLYGIDETPLLNLNHTNLNGTQTLNVTMYENYIDLVDTSYNHVDGKNNNKGFNIANLQGTTNYSWPGSVTTYHNYVNGVCDNKVSNTSKYANVNLQLSHTNGDNIQKIPDGCSMAEDKYLHRALEGGGTVPDGYYCVNCDALFCPVTFVTNCDQTVPDQNVPYGETATEPEPLTNGSMVFNGWYKNKELTVPYDFSQAVKTPLTLYAKWNDAGGDYEYDDVTRDGNTLTVTNHEVGEMTASVSVIDFGKTLPISLENCAENIGVSGAVFAGVSASASSTDFSKSFTLTGTVAVKANDTVKGTYGTLKVGDDGNLYYTPDMFMNGIDTFYYCFSAQHGGSTFYWYNTIKVIPATSVYYEDNFGGETAIVYTGKWETVGDASKSDSMQDSGEVGSGATPYGYDSSYANDTQFSNGTAKKVAGTTVLVNGRPTFEATASFIFTGTGFDIISRTDLNCGMISVLIFDNTTGTRIDTVPVVNKGVNELYQIPVITYKDLTYGTYRVVINVCAPSEILGLEGSIFYLDAIRIYDPMGNDAEAHKAYVSDKESNAKFINIRETIVDVEKIDVTDVNKSIFVDTIDSSYNASGMIGNIKNPQFTDEEKRFRTMDAELLQNYELLGPNEEVYISKGTGIGFEVVCDKLPETVQIGAKAPLGGTAKLLVKTVGNNAVKEISVSSATEMYYDITDAFKFVDGAYKATVVLTTTSDSALLSVTNLKTTFADSTAKVALAASRQVFAQVFDTVYVQNTASAPSYDVVNAAFAAESAFTGATVTLTFNTSKFVDAVIITDENGNEVELSSVDSSIDDLKVYSDDFLNAKSWTVTFAVSDKAGEHTYTVKAANGEGDTASASVTAVAPTVKTLAVISNPAKTTYVHGEKIDTAGLVLEAEYTDGTVKKITSGYTLSQDKVKHIGTNTITVSFDGAQTSFTVNGTSVIVQIVRTIIGFFTGR